MYVLVALLATSCSSSKTVATNAIPNYNDNYYTLAGTAPACITVMTISGGAKQKCDN